MTFAVFFFWSLVNAVVVPRDICMKMTRKKNLRKYCRFRFVYELRLADSSDFNLQLISDFIQQECLYPAYSMCKNSIMARKISLLAPKRLFAN